MNKIGRFLTILWCCFLIFIAFFEYNSTLNTKRVSEYINTFSLPATSGYNYTHLLNEDEKKVYIEALENLKQGKMLSKTSGLSKKSASRVADSILADHPEFFWLSNKTGVSGVFQYLTFSAYPFWKYTTSPNGYTEIFRAKVDSVVAEIKTYNTDDEKIRFAHDKLVREISYNHKAAAETSKKIISWFPKNEYQYAGTAYGALVNSSAVCAGYAKAFQILLNKSGYDCGYITGKTTGGLHAWNELYLNNTTYCFDVTWDDQGDYHEYPYDLSYKYYAISRSKLAENHTADELYLPATP